jgi:hypothetical protein
MRAVKTVKIIAALLIGLFLSVPHAALAQEPDQKAIGQDHPGVASTPSRNDTRDMTSDRIDPDQSIVP